MKVGDKIWVYESERRVYRRRGGRSFGPPIEREKWVPKFVIGESRVSWFVHADADMIGKEIPDYMKDRLLKIPKKGAVPSHVVLDEAEIDRRVWVRENCYWLGEAVQRCVDYDAMKKIAELVGYKSPFEETDE